jgi:hypothetical protein
MTIQFFKSGASVQQNYQGPLGKQYEDNTQAMICIVTPHDEVA